MGGHSTHNHQGGCVRESTPGLGNVVGKREMCWGNEERGGGGGVPTHVCFV